MTEPLTYAVPGLLFPAISLVLLAFTNRYIALASVVRQLIAQYRDRPDERVLRQVASLRHRLDLVRRTQSVGVTSLTACTVSFFCLLFGAQIPAQLAFAAGLVLMLASLVLSLREIHLSIGAIEIELDDVVGESR